MKQDVLTRFWNKTIINGNGCKEWTGASNIWGYGLFTYEGKLQSAHRVAWKFAHGEIPQGLLVCHKCDNRLCVNPEHLFLGTHKDNTQDMVAKKRNRRGEKHPNAKLTTEKANDIRRIYRETGISQKELAKQFGCSQWAVWNVVSQGAFAA